MQNLGLFYVKDAAQVNKEAYLRSRGRMRKRSAFNTFETIHPYLDPCSTTTFRLAIGKSKNPQKTLLSIVLKNLGFCWIHNLLCKIVFRLLYLSTRGTGGQRCIQTYYRINLVSVYPDSCSCISLLQLLELLLVFLLPACSKNIFHVYV